MATSPPSSSNELKINDGASFEFVVPFTMCIISKIRSGKTTLVKYLSDFFITNDKIDRIIVFCGSGEVNGDYKFMPKGYVHKFDPKIIEAIKKEQQTFIEKQDKKDGKGKERALRILIIFDDIISHTDQTGRNIISELYTSGSHYNISCIILTQYPKKEFTSAARDNTLYWLISRNTPNILKELSKYVDFNGPIGHFVEFVQKYTKDFNFLLNDNARMKKEGEHHSNGFWYQIKAEEFPPEYQLVFPKKKLGGDKKPKQPKQTEAEKKEKEEYESLFGSG
jgi:hypothetical protein